MNKTIGNNCKYLVKIQFKYNLQQGIELMIASYCDKIN